MALSLIPLLLLAAATITSLASASGDALDHGLDAEGLLMLGRFHGWMAAQGRSYATEAEKMHRFGIYRSNMESIEAANKDPRMSYQLGETPFTDLTHEEFMAMYSSGGLSSPEPEGEVITTRVGPVHEGGRRCRRWRRGGAYYQPDGGGIAGERRLEEQGRRHASQEPRGLR
jgi:hypothetical protein